MTTLKIFALTTCVVSITACTTLPKQPPEDYLRLHDTIPRSTHQFTVCNLAGCEEVASITLNAASWERIDTLFQPAVANSQEERGRIADAIALFEQLVADQAGTGDDQGGQQGAFHTTRQLDCVAETNNTTVYLLLLQQRELLQWHAPRYPQHRGFMYGEWPHNTAVMEDLQTGDRYAVDAYFHANGIRPEIVPVQEWVEGFTPINNTSPP